jgi:hypothetical protein
MHSRIGSRPQLRGAKPVTSSSGQSHSLGSEQNASRAGKRTVNRTGFRSIVAHAFQRWNSNPFPFPYPVMKSQLSLAVLICAFGCARGEKPAADSATAPLNLPW